MESKRKSKIATQREIVKERLLAGAKLTVWGCIRAYGFNTLAQRVYELRASGLAVLSVKVPNSQYYEYWLDETTIKAHKSKIAL